MAQFLVEAYIARKNGSDLNVVVGRLHLAAEALTSSGVAVRYLRSILVPADETCFHLLESPSIEAVENACTQAELPFNRVTEAVERVHQRDER
jgi:hypothetical protein